MDSLTVILSACLAVSEVLALIPEVKANSIFQIFQAVVAKLAK